MEHLTLAFQHMTKLIFGICLLGMALMSVYVRAQPETSAQGKILFILDGSGSMRAKMGNKDKMAIAKEVMTKLIKELPDNVQVGLEVYGHRRKDDCNDIEVLSPVGTASKGTLIKQIQAINPKGKTPITKSLELAAEQLEAVEEETTIVLISDGQETCEADPCAALKALKDQGIKVKVHVVGFGVTREEQAQLSCIAEAGQGKYFTARDANQLKAALSEVKQAVVQKVVAPPPPPSKPATETGIRLKTALAEGGEPIKKDLDYQISSVEQDLEGNRQRVAFSYDAQPLIKLNAGKYRLRVKHGGNDSNAVTEADIEVKAGQLAEQTINLESGYLRVAAVPAAGSQPIKNDLDYQVLSAEKDIEGNRQKAAFSYDPQPLFKLKAGKYHLRAKHGGNDSNAVTEADIEITAGQLAEQTVDLNSGYLRLVSVPAEGGKPIKKDLDYQVLSAEKDIEGNRQKAAFSYDPQPLFKLKAGKYHLRAKHGGNDSNAVTEADIEITAGQLAEQTVDLNSGYLRVMTVAADAGGGLKSDLDYQVLSAEKDLEGNQQRVAFSYDPQPLFKLKAGRYQLRVKHGAATATADIEIQAGKLQEQTINLNPQE
jgi:Ca-activated chloride channel family protein